MFLPGRARPNEGQDLLKIGLLVAGIAGFGRHFGTWLFIDGLDGG